MNSQFEHEGQTFQIQAVNSGNRYTVTVLLDGKLVSPEYSASVEIGHDYFSQHQTHIIGELIKIAENDIRNNIYFKPLP